MIQPHGAEKLLPLYVDDADKRQALLAEAATLPALTIDSAAAANAVMLAAGYFTPLSGYMNLADTLSVAREMKTTSGLFWPVPVLNRIADISAIGDSSRIALRDPNRDGNPIMAVMDLEAIEQISAEQLEEVTQAIFGTLDGEHPGVATFMSAGEYLLSGAIEVLDYSYFPEMFPDTFRTAGQIRNEIASLGWEKVVAFQTRNPMHRAHEELCKIALEEVKGDGLLIHMLLGKLKAGDIPADVRDDSIRTMVAHYFPSNTVLVSGYGFDMLYAGPREALLHAVFRQNAGCTHLIVGRDHAGVGKYYGGFDAQEIFDTLPDGAMEIEIFKADHTAWSKKLNKIVMMKDAPDHTPKDYIFLSGTKVREMLTAGEELPEEFSRPEVAHILMRHYQSKAS
uniref:Sulfate adenylyltransferase n=1 Tax=Magnetococcus massalia (strain MO-1) TaxID=451514 RepID=A0A1S7LFQ6_MAGMO|nr:Sulfate adenylyltransferase [Candidatus Magnetococcus massalia]